MRRICLFICLFISYLLPAQVTVNNNYTPPTRAQLEAKRKEIQETIDETEQQLAEIKKNKNATMSQLRTLQYKLAQRQSLIGNINDEIGSIDNSIKSSSKEIMTLKQKLELLKDRYAQSIRYSYETRSSYDMLAFLFSSGDFNDAMRRMKYLKKFRDFRKQQVDQIHQTQDQIGHKIQDLNKEKQEKDNLLITQKNQSQALVSDVKETNDVVQGLKGKEAQLQKEAEKNRKTAARINKAIQEVIQREMQAAMKRAEEEEKKKLAANVKPNPTTTGKTTTGKVVVDNSRDNPVIPKKTKGEAAPLMLTPTDVALSANFEGNRGKLYWPVAQGSISDHFGVHTSALSKYVEIDNDGVNIRTSSHAAVRAVFEGTVSSVFPVDGSNTVIVQHANYFTVYSNLQSVSVNKGQHVSTLQTIGVVGDNEEDEPTVKFQIWKAIGKSSSKLNPETWLGRAH